MSDPDDRLTGRQIVAGAAFSCLFCLVVFGGGYLLQYRFTNRPVKPPPTTTTTTTIPPTTTTTQPFANLRKSLDDYCAAKGRGHALIEVRGGAPIGGCTG